MTGYWFALVLCVAVVLLVLYLLRTQRIREKYAAIWLVLALAVVLLGVLPDLAGVLSRLVGVQTPINLVFALASAVLFGVCLQLSSEVSRSEEQVRTLAERVALLELRVDELEDGAASPSSEKASEPGDPTSER